MLSTLTHYINGQFGSKNGFLNSIKYKLYMWFGVYRKYQQIKFTKVKRLIFVCSGNICRSPFAEYVAIQRGINAESYGLHCRGGDPADPRAIEYAKNIGISMSSHITRNIVNYVGNEHDLIVVMEPNHLEELDLTRLNNAQVTIATLWHANATPYLHDPFNSALDYFHRCEASLIHVVDVMKEKMRASG